MWKHGKILEKTIFDPNRIIEYENCFGVILENDKHKKVDEALVDKEDIGLVTRYKWHLKSCGHVATRRPEDNKQINLHKFLVPGKQLDHKNRNKLDNRKSNIRECSSSLNNFNKDLLPYNTSGIAGVIWHKYRQKWEVNIMKDKNRIHIGLFKNFDNAIRARRTAEQLYFGELVSN